MKYYLRNQAGTFYVYADVSLNSTRCRLSTNIELVSEKNWDKKKEKVNRNEKDYIFFNDTLQQIKGNIEAFISHQKILKSCLSTDIFKNELESIISPDKPSLRFDATAVKDKSIITAMEAFIEERSLSIDYKPRTIEIYRMFLTNFKDFIEYNGKDLYFDDIDQQVIDRFKYYLSNNRHHTSTTVEFQFKSFRTLANWALEKGITNNINLHKTIRIKKESLPLVPDALTIEELKLLENAQMPDKRLERVKDIFLTGVYTGLRCSDLMQLEKNNIDLQNGLIRMRQTKTEDAIEIPITQKLLEILKKYNFKLPKFESRSYNRLIKIVCKLAGIETEIEKVKKIGNNIIKTAFKKYEIISSHTARRTFCTLSLKLGMRPEDVMKISGHRSHESFTKYYRSANSEAHKEMISRWDNL
jgi:integrase